MNIIVLYQNYITLKFKDHVAQIRDFDNQSYLKRDFRGRLLSFTSTVLSLCTVNASESHLGPYKLVYH